MPDIRIIEDLHDSDRPLCPQSFLPNHPLHAERIRTLDEFSAAATQDDEGEFTVPAVADAYSAAAYSSRDRMHLYSCTVRLVRRGQTIAAWFWRCGICGFVLPAQEVPATRPGE